MTRTRSAKGEIVDFDLLKIRQKLTAQPVTLDVKAREDFIDKKLRRRMRKVKAAAATVDPGSPVDSEALLAVETPVAAPLIDPPKETSKVEQTKQKNRPPVK
jgi:hypothetical protein